MANTRPVDVSVTSCTSPCAPSPMRRPTVYCLICVPTRSLDVFTGGGRGVYGASAGSGGAAATTAGGSTGARAVAGVLDAQPILVTAARVAVWPVWILKPAFYAAANLFYIIVR